MFCFLFHAHRTFLEIAILCYFLHPWHKIKHLGNLLNRSTLRAGGVSQAIPYHTIPMAYQEDVQISGPPFCVLILFFSLYSLFFLKICLPPISTFDRICRTCVSQPPQPPWSTSCVRSVGGPPPPPPPIVVLRSCLRSLFYDFNLGALCVFHACGTDLNHMPLYSSTATCHIVCVCAFWVNVCVFLLHATTWPHIAITVPPVQYTTPVECIYPTTIQQTTG